jgi:hypothetical protein
MGHFKKVIEFHKTWLWQKGYHEKLLNTKEYAGKLNEILKYSLFKAVQDSFADDAIQCFSASILGRFNKNHYDVLFSFQYEFNPNNLRLYLKSMIAEYKGLQIEYKIENNIDKHLPSALKVYDQLLYVEASKLAEIQEEDKNEKSLKKNNKLKSV